MKSSKLFYMIMSVLIPVLLILSGCSMSGSSENMAEEEATAQLSDLTVPESAVGAGMQMKLSCDSRYLYIEWPGYTGRDTINLLNARYAESRNFKPDIIIRSGRPARVAYSIGRILGIAKANTPENMFKISISFRDMVWCDETFYIQNGYSSNPSITYSQPTPTPIPRQVVVERGKYGMYDVYYIKYTGFTQRVNFFVVNGVRKQFYPAYTGTGQTPGWTTTSIRVNELPVGYPSSIAQIRVEVYNDSSLYAETTIRR